MRSLLLLGLLCMSCTRPNPGFGDDSLTSGHGDAGTDGGSSTGELPTGTGAGTGSASATVADDTTDPTTDPTAPPTDVPGESCNLPLHDGLVLELGDPDNFGGMCPMGYLDVPVKVSAISANEVDLEQCEEGCDPCFGTIHTLAIDAWDLGNHIPEVGTCLLVESAVPLGQTDVRCTWGAVTLHDPANDAAYVIATTAGAEPTSSGQFLLDGAVPPPIDDLECSCAELGFEDMCCTMEGPPTTLKYAIGDQEIRPGEATTLTLNELLPFNHSFQLFQAHWLHTCNAENPQTSWVVGAQL